MYGTMCPAVGFEQKYRLQTVALKNPNVLSLKATHRRKTCSATAPRSWRTWRGTAWAERPPRSAEGRLRPCALFSVVLCCVVRFGGVDKPPAWVDRINGQYIYAPLYWHAPGPSYATRNLFVYSCNCKPPGLLSITDDIHII
jgi:hypothetical protein